MGTGQGDSNRKYTLTLEEQLACLNYSNKTFIPSLGNPLCKILNIIMPLTMALFTKHSDYLNGRLLTISRKMFIKKLNATIEKFH